MSVCSTSQKAVVPPEFVFCTVTRWQASCCVAVMTSTVRTIANLVNVLSAGVRLQPLLPLPTLGLISWYVSGLDCDTDQLSLCCWLLLLLSVAKIDAASDAPWRNVVV